MKSYRPFPAIDAWTDGSCYPNPGPGGWAAVLIFDGIVKEISGNEKHTTSNIMELQAILEALAFIKRAASVTVYTDSNLCIGWLAHGWRRKAAHTRTVCETIDRIILEHGHRVTFEKVPAHVGVKFNERADYLANMASGHFQELENLKLRKAKARKYKKTKRDWRTGKLYGFGK